MGRCKHLWLQFMDFRNNEKVQMNISIITQFFCNVDVLQCFWPFKELLKHVRCTEIYFKYNNRLIFFWCLNFLGAQITLAISEFLWLWAWPLTITQQKILMDMIASNFWKPNWMKMGHFNFKYQRITFPIFLNHERVWN